MALSSHQPNTTKILVAFIVTTLSMLLINDVLLFVGFKNSVKLESKDIKELKKTAAKAETFESKSNEMVTRQVAGSVEMAIDKLNKQIEKVVEKLRRRIEEVDVNKSEATFTFEFKNVTDFLNAKGEARRSDESVYLRGLAFDLKLSTHASPQNGRYLAITLNANSPFSHVDFSIDVHYELRLVNQLPRAANWTDTNQASLKKSGNKLVWPYFITIDKLTNEGFIKNDTILLEIHLKCDKFVRLDSV